MKVQRNEKTTLPLWRPVLYNMGKHPCDIAQFHSFCKFDHKKRYFSITRFTLWNDKTH